MKRSPKGLFAVYGLRSVKCWIRVLHTIQWFHGFRFLESWFTPLIRIIIDLLWSEMWHFRTQSVLIEAIKTGELIALRFMNRAVIILKCVRSFTNTFLLLENLFASLLDRFQVLVVHSSQVIVLKLYFFQFWMKNIYFASIFKDHLIVQVYQGFGRWTWALVFDEGFPDFCLFKNQNFYDLSIRYKKLIQIIMSDYISVSIVYTNEKDGTLISLFIDHLVYNKNI